MTLIQSKFQCDFHSKKVKFFRCINAVLAKIASAKEIALTLKIVSANCFPILMYGIEACRPTKKKISLLAYAYNTVFLSCLTHLMTKLSGVRNITPDTYRMRVQQNCARLIFMGTCGATRPPLRGSL